MSLEPDEIDDKHEVFVRSDHATRATSAVSERRRNGELAPSTDLHTLHTLIPAADDLPCTQFELERVAPIPRGIELVPGVPRHADVVNLHEMAGRSGLAIAFDKIIDAKLLSTRLSVGKGHNWFALAHGANATRTGSRR